MTPINDEVPGQRWTEADSRVFARLAEVIVPARMEQFESICSLIPAEAQEEFQVVELGAGDGSLAKLVLDRYPRCNYLALDHSGVMRRKLKETLSRFGSRVAIRDFRLENKRWRAILPQPLRCIVASLVVHHLSGREKRRLFADAAKLLEPGGAILLADIVEPPNRKSAELFARQWNEIVREQSCAQTGDLRGYETFRREGWNFYEEVEHDEYDRPSSLTDQLLWLRDAGLKNVSCFWMRAGHAIFGGYRRGGTRDDRARRPRRANVPLGSPSTKRNQEPARHSRRITGHQDATRS